jgi:hypothetical protein
MYRPGNGLEKLLGGFPACGIMAARSCLGYPAWGMIVDSCFRSLLKNYFAEAILSAAKNLLALRINNMQILPRLRLLGMTVVRKFFNNLLEGALSGASL